MDWNKSNTVLIIAFIIVNIFLTLVVFDSTLINNNSEAFNEDFIDTVKSKLEEKGITVLCDISKERYYLPLLEVEYKLVEPNNDLIKKFLGEGIEAQEDVFKYSNDQNEKLEIINNKLIVYTKREPIRISKMNNNSILRTQQLFKFAKEKDISLDNYNKSFQYSNYEDGTYCIIYCKSFDNLKIENDFIKFCFDELGIYKMEIQQANEIKAGDGKIKVTSAPEILLTLLADQELKNKNILKMELCYFTKQDKAWEIVVKTNADPTWKIIFNDGTYQYLVEED